jgi:hypothetical protein
MKRTFTQADRKELLVNPEGKVFRKTARIVAVQMTEAFSVRTDRGPMEGSAGDWLATNHPEDDSGSDLWTISDERMKATYVEAEAATEGSFREIGEGG